MASKSSMAKGLLSLLWPRASQWRIYYHRIWVQLSTTCSNFTEVAQWGAPSCRQSQPATDNGVRDGRSNWLVSPPTLHRAVPPELYVLHTAMPAGLQITRLAALSEPWTCDLRNARPEHCLCGHSEYSKHTPWIVIGLSLHSEMDQDSLMRLAQITGGNWACAHAVCMIDVLMHEIH